MPLQDHELRYSMANELHARPFPTLQAPCKAVHLAIKQPKDAAMRDRNADRAHLVDLLDRFGAKHPPPGATHYFGRVGRYDLKWESHAEFVTYTLFSDGVANNPFDGRSFDLFPSDWLEAAPGVRVTSILIRVEQMDNGTDAIPGKVADWFVPESVAVSRVVDDAAVIASDFNIDHNGHMRMVVFAAPEAGPNRVGRIVQRLTEIETYKAMSMLGLAMARDLTSEMNAIETDLSHVIGDVSMETNAPDETLKTLLEIAARLENLSTQSTFRFGATAAYDALVGQRISVLREVRFQSRQTFGEFMMRRFDPSMRTVKAAETRLGKMSDRAMRAGDLLRTRVDVERSAQNQRLLASMDKRADLQLRLQKTVEGLSTVAISYYAANLAIYVATPFGEAYGLSESVLAAMVTIPVVILVALIVRRIRRAME